MSKSLKHRLPMCSELLHLQLEDDTLDSMRRIIVELEDEFKSVLEVNKKLCSLHHTLFSKVYDNFFQIALTDSEFNVDAINYEQCETTHEEFSKNIRQKKKATLLDNSPFNEKTYTQKTNTYVKYNNVFDRIFEKFKGKPTRIRLVKLAAGSPISPHIDYDPAYAVRVIIPVISAPECINVFWVKNEVYSVVFEPGKAYFLNTGYRHAVMNFSNTDRYTFMVTVDGTEDIDHLVL